MKQGYILYPTLQILCLEIDHSVFTICFIFLIYFYRSLWAYAPTHFRWPCKRYPQVRMPLSAFAYKLSLSAAHFISTPFICVLCFYNNSRCSLKLIKQLHDAGVYSIFCKDPSPEIEHSIFDKVLSTKMKLYRSFVFELDKASISSLDNPSRRQRR